MHYIYCKGVKFDLLQKTEGVINTTKHSMNETARGREKERETKERQEGRQA